MVDVERITTHTLVWFLLRLYFSKIEAKSLNFYNPVITELIFIEGF